MTDHQDAREVAASDSLVAALRYVEQETTQGDIYVRARDVLAAYDAALSRPAAVDAAVALPAPTLNWPTGKFWDEAAVRRIINRDRAARAEPAPETAALVAAEIRGMPDLTDAMRAVIRNENSVYGSEDELYAALTAAAALDAGKV